MDSTVYKEDKVLAVDFDGTIVNWSGSITPLGSPTDGVVDALKAFKLLGFKILIYSCRNNITFSGESYIAMKQYLDDNQIPYDEIDDGKNGKPVATYYIDDRAIRFDNNWLEILTFICKRELRSDDQKNNK